jgi:hypothetical protein
MSPTSRSLKWLRDRGWRAHVVEKRIPFRNITVDCFGGDILAIHVAQKLTMLVQATSDSNHSSHREKCLRSESEKDSPGHAEEIVDWLSVGNKFEIWSWKKGKCDPRREAITLGNFPENRSLQKS